MTNISVIFLAYYSCFLSTATVEHSDPSVCWGVLCVCLYLSVCLSLYLPLVWRISYGKYPLIFLPCVELTQCLDTVKVLS